VDSVCNNPQVTHVQWGYTRLCTEPRKKILQKIRKKEKKEPANNINQLM